jgi:hypothetical protein
LFSNDFFTKKLVSGSTSHPHNGNTLTTPLGELEIIFIFPDARAITDVAYNIISDRD